MTFPKKTVLIIVIVCTLVIAGAPLVMQRYRSWQFSKSLESIQQNELALEAAQYETAMKDTYGGKTPKETLDLFIAAVEKKDYELASKYFVIDQQAVQLNEFKKGSEADKINYLKILRSLKEEGFSDDKQQFTMRASMAGPDFFAQFLVYPNGIWKIVKI